MTTTQGDANHPFACRHTQDFPELLMRCGCSLMITTYQGGKVMMISPQDEDTLVQLPRAFDEPMGLALAGRKLALGTKQALLVFSNEPELAQSYPEKPGVYDAMFFPRRLYFTGQLSMHDLAWGNSGLLGVNTLFSCLCHFDSEHNFTPIWQPPFISELVPEDRCHLNGLALEDGEPRFVTALGETDQARAWSPGRAGGGIVMDLRSGEVITRGLAMPHSPRLHQGWLYVLESATGEVVRIDPQNKDEYQARTQLYLAELAVLHSWIRRQVNRVPPQQRQLVTSHDAFNYFCNEYKFTASAPAGWSTGDEVGGGVTPERRRQAVESIRKFGVKAIFVETSVNPELIQQIARDAGVRIGGTLYSDSMGPPGTAGETYLGMMRENVLKIVNALK